MGTNIFNSTTETNRTEPNRIASKLDHNWPYTPAAVFSGKTKLFLVVTSRSWERKPEVSEEHITNREVTKKLDTNPSLRRYNPEDGALHSHWCENLRSNFSESFSEFLVAHWSCPLGGERDRMLAAEWVEGMRCGRKRERRKQRTEYLRSYIQYTRLDSNVAVVKPSEQETTVTPFITRSRNLVQWQILKNPVLLFSVSYKLATVPNLHWHLVAITHAWSYLCVSYLICSYNMNTHTFYFVYFYLIFL
jgi:hypothetical protein